VVEQVYYAERQRAAEEALSRSEKDTVCVTNNQNGGLGSDIQCISLQACPPTAGADTGLGSHKGLGNFQPQ
jgi:hypothetical protein